MKLGRLARSPSCWSFIDPPELTTKRKSIFPAQPAGCCGPKSGMPMSHTMPFVPVLVDDASEVVEVELSGDGPLVEESAAEVSDPAGTVVSSGRVMPPKLDVS